MNLAKNTNPEKVRQKLNIEKDTPLVLFLGQKYSYKGVGVLVKAAQLIWKTEPETRFLFLGPQTNFSKRLFKEYSDPRIFEFGSVDLQFKSDALAACTLFCLPSSQESFGGVFTEAWAYKKPVIGANIPAVREVVDNELNGFLISPSENEIADKVVQLINNSQLRDSMGNSGFDKVNEKYDWPIITKKWESIYKSLL